MRITLATLFYFCVTICSAQIQFTRSDFGADGDKVIYAVDSPAFHGYNFGANGPGHTWQFNTSPRYPRRYDSTTFIAATVNPNAPNVTTNLLARSIGTGDQYLEVTDSFVKTTFDFLQVNLTGVKLKTLNLPLTYQSHYTDSTTATAKGSFADFNIDPLPPFDSIRIQAKVKLVSVCDGWGTIVLPDSTSYQALRVNQQIAIDADIYFHSIIGWTYVTNRKQQNGNYSWYAPGSKNFVANVQLDTSGNFSNFMYKIKKSPPTPKQRKLLSVSPNSITTGDTIQVLVRGYNTSFTVGNLYVYTPYCQILDEEIIDDTTLLVTLTCRYSAVPGTYYFEVGNSADGYLSLGNAFTIVASPYAPKLLSAGPAFGSPGETKTVTIRGSYTHFTKGLNINFIADSISPGDIFVQSFVVRNDTTVTCNISIESTVSYVPFTVYTSNATDGNLSLEGAFIVTHTGLGEDLSKTVQVYPNPASDHLTVLFPNAQNSGIVVLYDLAGREVRSATLSGNQNTLQLDGLRPSVYILKITGDEFSLTRKVVIDP